MSRLVTVIIYTFMYKGLQPSSMEGSSMSMSQYGFGITLSHRFHVFITAAE